MGEITRPSNTCADFAADALQALLGKGFKAVRSDKDVVKNIMDKSEVEYVGVCLVLGAPYDKNTSNKTVNAWIKNNFRNFTLKDSEVSDKPAGLFGAIELEYAVSGEGGKYFHTYDGKEARMFSVE